MAARKIQPLADKVLRGAPQRSLEAWQARGPYKAAGNPLAWRRNLNWRVVVRRTGRVVLDHLGAKSAVRLAQLLNALAQVRTRKVSCQAGRDGDCNWEFCPQEWAGRADYQNWCPLADAEDERE